MISSNLELAAGWKLKMFSTLKNWQHRIKEKEPEKVILVQPNSIRKGGQTICEDKMITW